MTSEEYIKLYQKFIEGKCNAEEMKQLFESDNSFKMVNAQETPDDALLKNKIKNRINQEINPKKIRLNKTWYYAAAAIAVLAMATLLTTQYKAKTLLGNKTTKNASMLGQITEKNAPILTLSDGTNIILNDVKNGLLSKEEGTEIKKIAQGELAYTASALSTENSNALNKITIPRGHTYKVILSDGTKVWLNAASTLSYPAAFTGTERLVSLTGEAYFEVAKNATKPFKVKMKSTEVEVLGTHFNISAYNDDHFIKTTLLEGSVRVAHLGTKKILSPNDQAITTENNVAIILNKTNAQQAITWKNGYFLFRDNTIEEVMSQVARWYKLEVIYQGKNNQKLFGGIYDRSKKLEELLKGLELTGLVKFKIEEGNSREERRVIVMD